MKTILFQGDSITDAIRPRDWDDYLGSGYAFLVAADLGKRYGSELRVLNRGISGNRISDVYARIICDGINLKPDVFSLLIGVNDVGHEWEAQNGVDTPAFERLYDLLLDTLQEALPETKILLMAPFLTDGSATRDIPEREGKWHFFSTEVAARAAAVERVANKHGVAFLPLQPLFDAAARRYGAQAVTLDGVHPTALGHRLIADAWLEAYEKL